MAVQHSINSEENFQKLFNFEEQTGIENIFHSKNKKPDAKTLPDGEAESQMDETANNRRKIVDINQALKDFKFNWECYIDDMRKEIHGKDGLDFLKDKEKLFDLNEASKIDLIDELEKSFFQAECLTMVFSWDDFTGWSSRIQHGALGALAELVKKSNVIKQKIKDYEKKSSDIKEEQCNINITTEKTILENINSKTATQNNLKNNFAAIKQIFEEESYDFREAYDQLTLITGKAKDLSSVKITGAFGRSYWHW